MSLYRTRRSRAAPYEGSGSAAGVAERAAHAAFDRRPFESLDEATTRYLAELDAARAAQLLLEDIGRLRRLTSSARRKGLVIRRK